MTNQFAKCAVLSLLLPGLLACDEVDLAELEEFEALDSEAQLGLYLAAPSRSLEAEKLQPLPVEPVPFEPEEGPTCGPSEVPMPGDLCPPTRQVGYFNGPCPTIYEEDPPDPHWTVETLFGGQEHPVPALEGYCRYVWTGNPDDIDPLPANIASAVGPDCRVFAQSPMANALAPAYTQAFREGTAPLPSAPNGGADVKIAVIDTAPSQTSKGQSGHGQAMAAIAGELSAGCVTGLGESSCRRKVETFLGLPQTTSGPNYDKGGFYGYQSELAEAIVEVLDQWPDPNAGDQKLILNLSVGWEPSADEFSQPEPAVQAIRDALAVGHCRGALIIAASGNRPPGTCFGDATGPGGWEREPGYTVAQCQGLGLVAQQIKLPDPLPAYHPFLYAATPLGWGRDNLPDLRVGSNARLTATGFAGFDEVRGRNYGPLSGSSVSTAVISGTASLAWSYFDRLHADELMGLLYNAGEPTGGDVSLHLGNTSPQQRQVSACGAVTHACDPHNLGNYLRGNQGTPAVCDPSVLTACGPLLSLQVDESAFADDFTVAFGQLDPSQSTNTMAPNWTALNCSQCGGVELTKVPSDWETEPEHMGWVVPEPHKPPCPHCHIKGPDLYLTLDPTYASYTLEAVSVHLYDATGGSEVLHYDPAKLTSLDATTVTLVFDTELQTVTGGLPPATASITMTFHDPNSIGGTRPITATNPLAIN